MNQEFTTWGKGVEVKPAINALVPLVSMFVVCSVGTAQGQTFYPLEIGNRWDFNDTSWGVSGGGTRETTSVSIVADTFMSNGLRYSIFNGQEPSGGLFARADFGTIIADTVYGTIVSADDNPSLPSRYSLGQNFPNPFNPTTSIRFTLPRRTRVSLKVFDILGREVATLTSGEFEAGTYLRQWKADQNSSGLYFYRLQTSDFVQTRQMILLR